MKKHMTLGETASFFGVEQVVVIKMIEHRWILPIEQQALDEEDVARIRLILDLRHQLGANDESIPIILHLMDQLYSLRNQLSQFGSSNKGKI